MCHSVTCKPKSYPQLSTGSSRQAGGSIESSYSNHVIAHSKEPSVQGGKKSLQLYGYEFWVQFFGYVVAEVYYSGYDTNMISQHMFVSNTSRQLIQFDTNIPALAPVGCRELGSGRSEVARYQRRPEM
jgi:hypothetical protein